MSSASWTTPDDLRHQVQRHWDSGRLLAAGLKGVPLFPLELRLRGPDTRELSERFDEVRQWIRELESQSRYRIEWREVNHRLLGRNRVPARIVVPGDREALELIGKIDDAARFRSVAASTLEKLPELAGWLARRPLTALEYAADWDRILTVLVWFREHPRCGLYLRQLDIGGVDTKFIESRKPLLAELLDIVLPPDALDKDAGLRNFELRYGLAAKPSQVRFRILDQRLAVQGLTDLAVPAREFASLDLGVDRVFITENEINGLAFPSLAGSIVIFGLGYGLDRLSEVRWLHDRALHYWGDIDTYGFHILDRVRALFPAAQSLLMDRETLVRHTPLWVRESDPYVEELLRLTTVERELYDDLRFNRLGERVRLEQERISYGWLRQALNMLI